MSFDEIKKEIEDWQETMQNMDAQFNALDSVLCLSYESPFFNAITKLQENYTKVVATNICDGEKWLEWFWLENGYGEKHLTVIIDREELSCFDAADLAAIIEKTQQ